MPKCLDCGAETKLHVNGEPVCPKCVEKRSELDITENPKSERDLKHSVAKRG